MHANDKKPLDLQKKNRMKRRSLGSGRTRKLDDDAEDFFVQCIEDKGLRIRCSTWLTP